MVNDDVDYNDDSDRNDKKRRNLIIAAVIVSILVLSFAFTQFNKDDAPGDSDSAIPGSPGTSQSESESPDIDGTIPAPPDDPESDEGGGKPNDKYVPPLPGENRAIPKDPNGKTVWDRWRPNRQPVAPGVTGYGGWGNVFWPTQKKADKIVAPTSRPPHKRLKVNSPHNREIKALTEGAYETTVEMFNINTRDYASMECGLAVSNRATNSFLRDMGQQCKFNREPSRDWEELQNRGVVLYVSQVNDWNEGQFSGYYDTPTNAFRGYSITLSAADQNGKRIPGIKDQKYIAYSSFSPAAGTYYINKLQLVRR